MSVNGIQGGQKLISGQSLHLQDYSVFENEVLEII